MLYFNYCKKVWTIVRTWQINKLHSTQFELLNFDGAIQFRCWGDKTSMLGWRKLGWGDVTWGYTTYIRYKNTIHKGLYGNYTGLL